MKIWALGFITVGALGVMGFPQRFILQGQALSDQARHAVDHLMMAGIGLIALGVGMWIAEPEPLLSTKATRRHHIIAAATSGVCGVLFLLTVIPGQSVWWRWVGVAVSFAGMAVEAVKAVRFTATARP